MPESVASSASSKRPSRPLITLPGLTDVDRLSPALIIVLDPDLDLNPICQLLPPVASAETDPRICGMSPSKKFPFKPVQSGIKRYDTGIWACWASLCSNCTSGSDAVSEFAGNPPG